MLKYTTAQVVFREIPDEVTLAINISNCPYQCVGCHSPELRGDIGEELTIEKLDELVKANEGITCICIMGGDSHPQAVKNLLNSYKMKYNKSLKTAWYSGRECTPEELLFPTDIIDFIKIGPYKADRGPINEKSTNQRLYQSIMTDSEVKYEDITYKFWNDTETL